MLQTLDREDDEDQEPMRSVLYGWAVAAKSAVDEPPQPGTQPRVRASVRVPGLARLVI